MKFWPIGRGAIWTDGIYRSAAFQTILPPNSLSCTSDQGDMEGVLSVSSYHTDGVHVCFADGRVRFVSNTIDAGDNTAPSVALPRAGLQGAANPGSPSPYGVWGAMGTRAAKERLEIPERDVMEPQQDISKLEKQEIMSQPLQTWAAADGNTTWKGWQIDLQSESFVILLTESEDVQRVSLADLKSADAYRAVQHHLQEMLDARKRLRSQLESGVELLEQKKFTEFARDYVVGGNLDAKSMGAFIAPQRGLIIHAFESSLRQLADPNAPGINLTDNAEGDAPSVRIDLNRINRAVPNLQLKYIDGRWKLSP
ncbi:MAG: DUF1559 domain-containing protein [Pirellulaceae bacterium]|nr:DUF1559 domain-containing protein [Pirellulaceae bacterium]